MKVENTAAYVQIINSSFSENSALEGSIFYVSTLSILNFQNTEIFENFAMQGGVGVMEQNGIIMFNQINFHNNYALSYPGLEISECSFKSSVIYSNFTNNHYYELSDIISESRFCISLCFITSEYFSYFISKAGQYSPHVTLFDFVLSNMEFRNVIVSN